MCQIQVQVEISSSSGPPLTSCPAFNPFPAHQGHPSIVKSPAKAQSSLTMLCKGTASSDLPRSSFSVAISLMTPPLRSSLWFTYVLFLMPIIQSKLQSILCFGDGNVGQSGWHSRWIPALPAQVTPEAVQALCTPKSWFPAPHWLPGWKVLQQLSIPNIFLILWDKAEGSACSTCNPASSLAFTDLLVCLLLCQ